MQFQGVFLRVALAMLWAFSTIAQPGVHTESQVTPKSPTTLVAAIPKYVTNSSVHNSTHSNNRGLPKNFNVDSSMIQRALYVLIGITIFGVLYFIVRAVRLKKTTHSRKKYGLLSNYDNNMEMDQMESDEDETVYEARTLRR